MFTFALSLALTLGGDDKLPSNGTEPNWSRDGSKIAFGVSEGKERSLWTMSADGSNPRKLVPAGESQHYLRWFPDSSRLAFVAKAGDGFEFFSINPDGTDRKPLLPEKAPKPGLVPIEWSADGKWVAYPSRPAKGAPPKVVIVDHASGDVVGWTPGTEFSHSSSFSPDGNQLVYLSQRKMWLADARGQNGQVIVEGTPESFPIDPTWSPDGKLILYGLNNQEYCELWTVRPDGAQRKRLYSSPLRFFYPTWSPKGDRILMAMRQTDKWDLWLFTIDREGKNLARVVGEESGAPIFTLLGDYKIEGQAWPKPGEAPQTQTGTSKWSRALGGNVVREHWNISTGKRPFVGELSITRSAPNTYEAVQLNEWTGEQQFFTGTWDGALRILTFDRVLPEHAGEAPKREFVRMNYHFEPDGSFRRETFVGDPKGKLVKQSELRYVKVAG
ncbi:MAG: PD40 domain-containing protein [Planctomycetes bacterium]|nr:PD40 domain-containing protein [Planctomycetota bacterium]